MLIQRIKVSQSSQDSRAELNNSGLAVRKSDWAFFESDQHEQDFPEWWPSATKAAPKKRL